LFAFLALCNMGLAVHHAPHTTMGRVSRLRTATPLEPCVEFCRQDTAFSACGFDCYLCSLSFQHPKIAGCWQYLSSDSWESHAEEPLSKQSTSSIYRNRLVLRMKIWKPCEYHTDVAGPTPLGVVVNLLLAGSLHGLQSCPKEKSSTVKLSEGFVKYTGAIDVLS